MNCRRLIGLLPRTNIPYHIIEWALCFAANLAADGRKWVNRRRTLFEDNRSASLPISRHSGRHRERQLCAKTGLMQCSAAEVTPSATWHRWRSCLQHQERTRLDNFLMLERTKK